MNGTIHPKRNPGVPDLSSGHSEALSLLFHLYRIPGLGPTRIRSVMQTVRSIRELKLRSEEHLSANPKIGARYAADIIQAPFDPTFEEKILHQIKQVNGWILPFWDERFPSRLNLLPGMPAILYGLGNPAPLNNRSLAIVGTRLPTPYGKKSADYFSTELTTAGYDIVSGLARGIDTVAHQACLAAGGTTVAVLGSGLMHLYPPENKELISRILVKGCVITEYPPDTPPDAKNFPDRNRIIAGLSEGTLVVEAAETGGALITAAYALDMNREVFAIPGDIFQQRSVGTNRLIQNGQAKLVISPTDVLVELSDGISTTQLNKPVKEFTFNLFENRIWDELSSVPMHVDVLAERLGNSTGELLIQLLNMEFQGAVRQLPGKYFIRDA